MSTSFNFPFAAAATTGYFEAHPMSSSPLEIGWTMLCKPVSYAAVQQHSVCTKFFLTTSVHCESKVVMSRN